MTQRSPTKKEIMEWLQANGLSPQTISDNTAEYRFSIKRGSITLYVVRPNDKAHVVIHGQFRLPHDKENLYTPEKDLEFKRSVTERFPTLDVDIRFSSGSAFVVWDQVFDDGFNYDRLFRAIRNVTHSGLSLHGLLLSVIGLDIPLEVSDSEKQGPTYYA